MHDHPRPRRAAAIAPARTLQSDCTTMMTSPESVDSATSFRNRYTMRRRLPSGDMNSFVTPKNTWPPRTQQGIELGAPRARATGHPQNRAQRQRKT